MNSSLETCLSIISSFQSKSSSVCLTVPSCYNPISLLCSLSLIHLNSPRHYIIWSAWWPCEVDISIFIWQMGKLPLDLCPSRVEAGLLPEVSCLSEILRLWAAPSAGASGYCCRWGGKPPSLAGLWGGRVWACPPACMSTCPLSSWHCYPHHLWHPVPFYLPTLFKVTLVTVAFLALITIYNYRVYLVLFIICLALSASLNINLVNAISAAPSTEPSMWQALNNYLLKEGQQERKERRTQNWGVCSLPRLLVFCPYLRPEFTHVWALC